MSACLLQQFVNKLNEYEPGLMRKYIAPDVQTHLDRLAAEEQDKQEFILQSKWVELNMFLGNDYEFCTSSEPGAQDKWIEQDMILEDMLEEVQQDMAVMDITPLYDPYSTDLDAFYERFPIDKFSSDFIDIWEGNFPPRFFT